MSTEAHRLPRSAHGAVGAKTPAELASAILRLFLEGRMDRVKALIHSEAELEAGFATPGARFDATGVMNAAWVAASTGAYQPEYELVESLDGETALVGVRIRYVIGEDLFSERDAAYLMRFKDGLLWRSRIFDSIDEALAAHRGEPSD